MTHCLQGTPGKDGIPGPLGDKGPRVINQWYLYDIVNINIGTLWSKR